jgi:hypothetical protein
MKLPRQQRPESWCDLALRRERNGDLALECMENKVLHRDAHPDARVAKDP